MSDRVEFTCNGDAVGVDAAPGESLLSVLRERLGITSVKDGCAPQGQCGCCTVWVDGQPRVACVTPAARVVGRAVTTVEGLAAETRDDLAARFVATGGAQCGFCTPGIVMRLAAAMRDGKTRRVDLDRSLAAHLCRCTGWLSILEVVQDGAVPAADGGTDQTRSLLAATQRATLEGDSPQIVGVEVPVGTFDFADDGAPRDALVAVPAPDGIEVEGAVMAAGIAWVVEPTMAAARARAAKVQGRRTSLAVGPPLARPDAPDGGFAFATRWLEPGYLEPDASWCGPGGEPASPLANGGAFGGKRTSPVGPAAAELARVFDRPVRTVFAREDVVRFGPKRPPIAATALWRDGGVYIDGVVVSVAGRDALSAAAAAGASPYGFAVAADWRAVAVPGPAVSTDLRAFAIAEQAVLVAGALAAAGVDGAALVSDPRAQAVRLDTCVGIAGGAFAGARVRRGARGIEGIEVRVDAGDPLDEIVLRSYAIGAAHMALGWLTSEHLTVDPETGAVLDLTIRSFGMVRPKDTPPIHVEIVRSALPPCPRASDAVFSAVAAALAVALA
jgi:xanthine dehydrogenase small subunit